MLCAEKNRLISRFLYYTTTDSVSFGEELVAYRLKRELKELGFEVTEDEAGSPYGTSCGNLYGFLKGTADKEPVLFSSHMDTVGPGFDKRPFPQTGRILSGGETVLGADDISGVVEILEGIRLAKQDPQGHGDIEVLFTIAEEVYGKGARAFDFGKIISRDAYVLDMSGSPGAAARKAPSIVAFESALTGKASHAGFAPEKGVNALAAAANAIARIPQGRISERTTLNIGTLQAGAADNIVPQNCRATGEVRSFDHEEALEQVRRVGEIFREEAEALGAQADFDQIVHIKAYETPEDAEVCQCFLRACRELGLPGELKATHGGSDNNIFAEYGLEGIVLSCGMYRTHSPEEYTLVEDLAAGAELVAAIIRERKQRV